MGLGPNSTVDIAASTPLPISSTPTMSSPAPAAPIEQLPANIPHLEPDGTNWAVFLMHFCMAMQATCQWGFFDGTNLHSTPEDPSAVTDTEKELVECWKHNNLIACYLLSQCLPDMTTLCPNQYILAHMCWTHVSDEYTAKSVYAYNNLQQAFFEMICSNGGNVCTFLTSMRYKCEELAAAGVRISNKDYQHTVLRGISDKLARFASQLLTAVCLTRSPNVDTGTLIDHICEEADRLKNRHTRGQKPRGGKKDGIDEALAATGSEREK
jgi:hypothetical protein